MKKTRLRGLKGPTSEHTQIRNKLTQDLNAFLSDSKSSACSSAAFQTWSVALGSHDFRSNHSHSPPDPLVPHTHLSGSSWDWGPIITVQSWKQSEGNCPRGPSQVTLMLLTLPKEACHQ